MPTENNKAFNSTVIKLGFVSFFANTSIEMLYPITPIFLATALGISMTSVGYLMAAVCKANNKYFYKLESGSTSSIYRSN